MELIDQINLVCFLYVCLFSFLSLRSFINSSSYFHKYRKSIQKNRKGIYKQLLFGNRYIRHWTVLASPIVVFGIVVWVVTVWITLKISGSYVLRMNHLLLYPLLTIVILLFYSCIPFIIKSTYSGIEIFEITGTYLKSRTVRLINSLMRIMYIEPYQNRRQVF